MKPTTPAESRSGLTLLVLFLLLAIGLIGTGVFYYRDVAQKYHTEVVRNLTAVAALKQGELAQWRKERLGDGAILFQNVAFGGLVRRFLENAPDGEAQRQLLDWLSRFSRYAQYDRVWLLDPQGKIRLAAPSGSQPADAVTVQRAAEVGRSGQVLFQDFYRNEQDQRVYLAVMVPIFDERGGPVPLGVLVLRIDPELYLYPFIKRWPTTSLTAETLLLRRDGNDILYLNDLRHRADAALTIRIALTRTELPAVKAGLGQTGVVDGVDYRRVPVLAIAGAVPDSPWFLIAKIDAAEVAAPLRDRLWQIVAMIGALVFGAGGVVGLVWRQQRSRFDRDRAAAAAALQEKNAELERFLYTASHDLRSPVVTVQTFLGYLEKDMAAADAERIATDVGFIRSAADRMVQLLDDLLAISRIGRVVSPPVVVTFRAVVADACAAVAGRLTERGVTVQVGDHAVLLTGDRLRLVEVFQNLIDNAGKFMGGQPAPRIEIGVAGPAAKPVFFVRDNGLGIDPLHQAKVFELFERLDSKIAGTGIGLAIVKRIVELYGGRIWVESAGPGQGACFYFTLPRAVDQPIEGEKT